MATKPPPGSAGASTAREVAELWQRVAEERGLDFQPAPRAVEAAIPDLVRVVDDVSAGLADAQERRWLAALLAALSHRVEVSTLDDPPVLGGVAVAVVTGEQGVLVGRRRDGIPRWVFPGGWIEDGETPTEGPPRSSACSSRPEVHQQRAAELAETLHEIDRRQVPDNE